MVKSEDKYLDLGEVDGVKLSAFAGGDEDYLVDLSDATLRAYAKAYIDVAIRIQELVKNKEYNSFLTVLDKVKIKGGGSLGVRLGNYSNPMQRESDLVITTPEGNEIDDEGEDFWNCLEIENSPMGAWQAYVLGHVWSYLPLFDHANYGRKWYVYTNEQQAHLKAYASSDHTPEDWVQPPLFDVIPYVIPHDGYYQVSACFWSNFGGLHREVSRVTLGEHISFELDEQLCEVLYEYDCGICY